MDPVDLGRVHIVYLDDDGRVLAGIETRDYDGEAVEAEQEIGDGANLEKLREEWEGATVTRTLSGDWQVFSRASR